jgi:glutamate synthase domain-containing protein 2
MRQIFVLFSIISIFTISILSYFNIYFLWAGLFIFPIILLGIFDMLQTKKTIRRNFPVLGRFRYLLESIRPEIQQYFVESDVSGRPFNRLERSVIYQRSKKDISSNPFGTQLDVYQVGYEWMNHSINSIDFHKASNNPRVKIGSSQCLQPYEASIFNISAMSFGSLSSNAILALNGGAKMGKFFHNTGEGGLSPYHLKNQGDIVWNIGTGYFSTRNEDGTFSPEAFEERSKLPSVKMIEIKFSQGAKPGHGGILPKEKITEEIAKIRLIKMGKDCISPPFHSAFKTPIELMSFVRKLRQLSGGKPIGIKLCVGNQSEFMSVCKAMIETNTLLDFITVDGGEGGTGAAPQEFSDHVGMPLRDAIAFVYDCLKGFGLKDEIKIICSGKIITGFDIIKNLALGADVCNSARGMMMALGCIQALQCHKNTCPTGVATQNPKYTKGLVVEDKKVRVARYHIETVKSAVELMCAAGIDHPDKIDRKVVNRRVSATSFESYEVSFPEIEKGSFLDEATVPEKYKTFWKRSSSERF